MCTLSAHAGHLSFLSGLSHGQRCSWRAPAAAPPRCPCPAPGAALAAWPEPAGAEEAEQMLQHFLLFLWPSNRLHSRSSEQGLTAHLLALSSGTDSQFPRLPLLLATATLSISPPNPRGPGHTRVHGKHWEAPGPSAHCNQELCRGAENNQNDLGLFGEM